MNQGGLAKARLIFVSHLPLPQSWARQASASKTGWWPLGTFSTAAPSVPPAEIPPGHLADDLSSNFWKHQGSCPPHPHQSLLNHHFPGSRMGCRTAVLFALLHLISFPFSFLLGGTGLPAFFLTKPSLLSLAHAFGATSIFGGWHCWFLLLACLLFFRGRSWNQADLLVEFHSVRSCLTGAAPRWRHGGSPPSAAYFLFAPLWLRHGPTEFHHSELLLCRLIPFPHCAKGSTLWGNDLQVSRALPSLVLDCWL